jgi:hypothetical protein
VSLGAGDPDLADELALELEDGILLSQQFVEAGWLRPEARQIIVDIGALLALRAAAEHEDFWRLNALRDSAEWAHSRELTVSALIAL